jgi:hypothetical protein
MPKANQVEGLKIHTVVENLNPWEILYHQYVIRTFIDSPYYVSVGSFVRIVWIVEDRAASNTKQ